MSAEAPAKRTRHNAADMPQSSRGFSQPPELTACMHNKPPKQPLQFASQASTSRDPTARGQVRTGMLPEDHKLKGTPLGEEPACQAAEPITCSCQGSMPGWFLVFLTAEYAMRATQGRHSCRRASPGLHIALMRDVETHLLEKSQGARQQSPFHLQLPGLHARVVPGVAHPLSSLLEHQHAALYRPWAVAILQLTLAQLLHCCLHVWL